MYLSSQVWHPPTVSNGLSEAFGLHTSRKLCGKKTHSFSHCSSFDHHALQSLNNCIIWFFWIANWHFRYFGARNIFLTRPKTYNCAIAKWKIKFCNRLVTAHPGGQKNRDWENDYDSFSRGFLLVMIVGASNSAHAVGFNRGLAQHVRNCASLKIILSSFRIEVKCELHSFHIR